MGHLGVIGYAEMRDKSFDRFMEVNGAPSRCRRASRMVTMMDVEAYG